MGVTVALCTGVFVLVSVIVQVDVIVFVAVGVLVSVAVLVAVFVKTSVPVKVGVAEGVIVNVPVGVLVFVAVLVGVFVGVIVAVSTSGVIVGVFDNSVIKGLFKIKEALLPPSGSDFVKKNLFPETFPITAFLYRNVIFPTAPVRLLAVMVTVFPLVIYPLKVPFEIETAISPAAEAVVVMADQPVPVFGRFMLNVPLVQLIAPAVNTMVMFWFV